jgi:hypothetical protein
MTCILPKEQPKVDSSMIFESICKHLLKYLIVGYSGFFASMQADTI